MATKKKNGKSSKEQLAAGAADIKSAEKAAAVLEPVVLAPLTRPLSAIVADRVRLLEGNIGVQLSDDTTIEESLAILDWSTQMSDHVGFIIGDVLNFGEVKWGTKYAAALNQTGRALSTLKGYAEVARRIAPAQRVAQLTFTHHREIIRLPDEKVAGVLKEASEQADKGEAPSTRELRYKIQKLVPRKRPKRVTSGKHSKNGKKGSKPEPPPYVPTSEEQSKLDLAEDAIKEAVKAVKEGKVYLIVARLANKEKRRWVELTEPIKTFYDSVDRVTGNYR